MTDACVYSNHRKANRHRQKLPISASFRAGGHGLRPPRPYEAQRQHRAARDDARSGMLGPHPGRCLAHTRLLNFPNARPVEGEWGIEPPRTAQSLSGRRPGRTSGNLSRYSRPNRPTLEFFCTIGLLDSRRLASCVLRRTPGGATGPGRRPAPGGDVLRAATCPGRRRAPGQYSACLCLPHFEPTATHSTAAASVEPAFNRLVNPHPLA